MKHLQYIFGKMKGSGWNMVFFVIFIIVMLCPTQLVQSQSYHQNTGYLFQKIEPYAHDFYIPFKHRYVLPYCYGYYVVTDSVIQSFFDSDSVSYHDAILLCDPAYVMFSDSATTRHAKISTRIMDIMLLDDSEIYEIGGDKYLIRKIRYAYLNNDQSKVYIKGSNYFLWDDISYEDTTRYYATYEVGQLWDRDYYQCYIHLIEILPTPQYIQKYLWKRLYELANE